MTKACPQFASVWHWSVSLCAPCQFFETACSLSFPQKSVGKNVNSSKHASVIVTLARLLVLRSFPRIFEEKRDCSQSRVFHTNNNLSNLSIRGLALIFYHGCVYIHIEHSVPHKITSAFILNREKREVT